MRDVRHVSLFCDSAAAYDDNLQYLVDNDRGCLISLAEAARRPCLVIV